MKSIGIGALSLVLFVACPAISMASPATQGPLHSQAWDYAHLRPSGLAKCHAFRSLWRQTIKLQKGGDGTLPVEWRRELETKLAAAKSRPPKSVTPAQCGVPL
jgi:hypothetical protein